LTRKSALSNPTTPTKVPPSFNDNIVAPQQQRSSTVTKTPTTVEEKDDFYDIVLKDEDEDEDEDARERNKNDDDRNNDVIAQNRAFAKQCPPWLDASSDYRNTS
jgi:hypothetical protein